MNKPTCADFGCVKQHRKMQPLWDRFWSKVDKAGANGCWLWTGHLKPAGYGHFIICQRGFYPHRLAYQFLVGPIPDGLVLDHLCRVPNCVNPDHLEPVTQGENVFRTTAPPSINRLKTHCVRGHSLDDAYIRKGKRTCRTCQLNVKRKYYVEVVRPRLIAQGRIFKNGETAQEAS